MSKKGQELVQENLNGFLALIRGVKREFRGALKMMTEQGIGNIITEESDNMAVVFSGSVTHQDTKREKHHVTFCLLTNDKLQVDKVTLVLGTMIKELDFPLLVDMLKEKRERDEGRQ